MPFFLDGNNLIGQSAEEARRRPAVRRAFLEQLSRYTRSRGGRFTVYFDGDTPDSSMPPPGVRVRYSAPLSTDDAILQSISGASEPTAIIVVTNDRRLGSRCRDAGAKVIDWSEFSARMNRVPRRSRGATAKEERVDVDDWARYFGVDPKTMK
jgi:predicted RNA-binding protein with PIN domain